MADTKAIFLTEEDQALLKKLIEGEKNKLLNTKIPPPPPPPRNGRTMYLALPETEITALTDVGTGDSAESMPGYGYCELYRLADDGLHSLGTRLEQVYNLSRSVITRDWIQVHQDGFGNWWAITGGSSSCDEVYFIITDTGEGTGSGSIPGVIKAMVLERPCGCETVPGEVDGYIELTSMPCLTLFVGAYGWAKYMQSLNDGTGTGTGTGTAASCHWRIHSLCCET